MYLLLQQTADFSGERPARHSQHSYLLYLERRRVIVVIVNWKDALSDTISAIEYFDFNKPFLMFRFVRLGRN